MIRTCQTTVTQLDKTNILKLFWRPSWILPSLFSLLSLSPYLISKSMHFSTYLPSLNIVEKSERFFSLTAALIVPFSGIREPLQPVICSFKTTLINTLRYTFDRLIPANTRHSGNAGLMLTHRLRRWSNLKPALAECLVFAGILLDIGYPGT